MPFHLYQTRLISPSKGCVLSPGSAANLAVNQNETFLKLFYRANQGILTRIRRDLRALATALESDYDKNSLIVFVPTTVTAFAELRGGIQLTELIAKQIESQNDPHSGSLLREVRQLQSAGNKLVSFLEIDGSTVTEIEFAEAVVLTKQALTQVSRIEMLLRL